MIYQLHMAKKRRGIKDQLRETRTHREMTDAGNERDFVNESPKMKISEGGSPGFKSKSKPSQGNLPGVTTISEESPRPEEKEVCFENAND